MRAKYEKPKIRMDVIEEEDIVTRSGLTEDGEYDDGKDNTDPGGNDWDDMWW